MEKYQHERVQHETQIPALIASLDAQHIKEYFPKDVFIPTHWHRSLEIALIENAEVILQIGEKEYLIEDDFTFVNSGVVHSLRAKSLKEDPHCIIVVLTYDFLKQYVPQIDNIVFNLYHKDEHKKELKQLFYKLKDLYIHQDEYTYLDINACLLEILSLLLHFYQEPLSHKNSKTSKNQTLVKEVLTY